MFDVEVAKEVGIIAAILFQNIAFWCQHSQANARNFHDGEYWTFNTNKAFCELFPYMTSKSIRNALQKLVDSGLIVTGNYNEKPYDRTIWYSLSQKGKCIFQKGQMDLPVGANGISQKGEPIPYINTYINPDINTDTIGLSGFYDFWKAYPNKVKKSAAITAWKSGKCEKIADTIIADVQRRCDTEWKGDGVQYVPHPTTYLHQRRWEDETPPQERKDTIQTQAVKTNPALGYKQRDYKDEDFGDDFYIDLDKYGEG